MDRQRGVGYALFVSLFLAEVVVISFHPENVMALQAWQIVCLGAAAFRGGRALSYNNVFSWLRAPFTQVVKDSSGAGDSVEPKGEGFWFTVGDLLCCPICTGTHVASLLLTIIAFFPTAGLAATYILAAAGTGEVLNWFAEKCEWEGRRAREQAGTEWLAKHDGHISFPLPTKVRVSN